MGVVALGHKHGSGLTKGSMLISGRKVRLRVRTTLVICIWALTDAIIR